MSNVKWQSRKLKYTPAEALVKRKYDQTKAHVKNINSKQVDAEDFERHFAKQRKLARQPTIEDSQTVTGGQTAGTRLDANMTNNIGTANIHNNINVAINYTVHHNETVNTSTKTTANRRKNNQNISKKRKSQEPRSISDQDLMNSQVSKMLDQQLLMANQNN